MRSAVAPYLHIRARRKNGVQVRRQYHNLFLAAPPQLPNHVAGLVAVHRQARSRQQRLDRRSSRLFMKRRRGNFRQLGLQLINRS